MPKPKKPWTIRNVKNFSRYVDRSIGGASTRRFKRDFERAERMPTDSEKKAEHLKLGQKLAKHLINSERGNYDKLQLKTAVNLFSDTALKCSGLKKSISAEAYLKLTKVTRKYLKMHLLENRKEKEKALLEIVRICGPENSNKLINELCNTLNITGQITS